MARPRLDEQERRALGQRSAGIGSSFRGGVARQGTWDFSR